MPGPLEEKVVERKRKLLEMAPRLPFDIDLYYWEEENLSVPTLLPLVLITICGYFQNLLVICNSFFTA